MTKAANRTLAAAGGVLVYASVVGLVDNFVRAIAADAGLWQFHATRSAMALVLLGLGAVLIGLRLRPLRWRAVLARSAIHATSILVYFGALGFLPVAQVAAGIFTAPIFVLLIQRLVYGQPIGGVQALAVALGFAGAIIVLGPEAFAGASLAAALPIAAGAVYAMGNIATRAWCEGESAATLLAGFFAMLGLYGLIGMAVLTLMPVPGAAGAEAFLILGPVWPTEAFLWWTLLQAVGSLVGVGMMIWAYQIAEVWRVSVFEYAFLPASAFWTWVIWGETLVWTAWIGMALIVLAGVLIARAGQSATASRQ